MSTRIDLQPAWLLHSRPYRDTSLLIDVLSRDHGRVSLVARGVRRRRSSLGALLQPFSPLLLSWSGRHELKTFTGAERNGPLSRLDGHSLASGFYANELLLRLTGREDPHPPLYDIYAQLLDALQVQDGARAAALRAQERALRVFEKCLLDELGYGLVLDHDVHSGAAVQPQQHYDYFLHHGPVAPGSATGVADVPSVRIRGAALLALAGEALDDACLGECKRLMRMALAPLLGKRPLYSRQLFRGLQGVAGRAAADELDVPGVTRAARHATEE